MKHKNIRQNQTKLLKTVAKLNLLNVLNESITKPIKKFIKHEILDRRREKLKHEFHYQETKSENLDLDSKFAKTRKCDYVHSPPASRSSVTFNSSPCRTASIIVPSSSVKNQIAEFIVKHKPTTEMLTDIFDLLKSVGLDVNDTTNNTLLATSPRKFNKIEYSNLTSGEYIHFGIERFLKRVLKINGIKIQNEDFQFLYIDIAFYIIKAIDKTKGIEVPRYLVILGRPAGGFYNHNCKEAFVIGLYHGVFSSPNVTNEVLRPFVDEILALQENHIVYNNIPFSVQIRAIICDPIANSLVTCTTLPESLYGCSKCTLKGKLRIDYGITSFSENIQQSDLRSDDDFTHPDQIQHHTGVPIIRDLDVGLISQFYIDYKHTVCMGVMKSLLELWMFKGKLDYRLNKKSLSQISDELKTIGDSIPKEFTSKPKTLDEFNNWDAYDFRQFLLYYGPVVLQKRLPQKYYVHFLHLNLSLRIMINPDTQIDCSAKVCSGLLKGFVQDFSELYGSEWIDYNVHNLLHLDEIIFKSFSIDSVGGFTYSKQMDFITNLLSQNDSISIENLATKIEEHTNMIFENRQNVSSMNYPYLDENMDLVCRYATLSKNKPDNCVITSSGEIVLIDEIKKSNKGEIVIIGYPATSIVMYQAPITIQKMMLIIAKLTPQLYKLTDIKAKAVKISLSSGDYVLPLLTP